MSVYAYPYIRYPNGLNLVGVRKSDLRVVKTHRNIRNGLVELLRNKEFNDFTVQELLEVAMINRATFYKYYRGLDDLAGEMIEDFKNMFSEALRHRFDLVDRARFLGEISPELFSKKDLVMALWKIKTPRHNLYGDMMSMIKDAYSSHAGDRNVPPENVDYQATIFATLALTTTQYFLERNQPVPVKRVYEQWSEIISLTKL